MSRPAPLSITDLLGPAADMLAEVSDHLYGQLLAWLLIAVGIWFTVRTRGLQFRLFGQMLRAIAGSRAGRASPSEGLHGVHTKIFPIWNTATANAQATASWTPTARVARLPPISLVCSATVARHGV